MSVCSCVTNSSKRRAERDDTLNEVGGGGGKLVSWNWKVTSFSRQKVFLCIQIFNAKLIFTTLWTRLMKINFTNPCGGNTSIFMSRLLFPRPLGKVEFGLFGYSKRFRCGYPYGPVLSIFAIWMSGTLKIQFFYCFSLTWHNLQQECISKIRGGKYSKLLNVVNHLALIID